MKLHKIPKLFEYDETEEIVDVFVKKDPDCPYPYHEDDCYHQGFYLENFIIFLNLFFVENDLPYIVINTENTEYDTLEEYDENADNLPPHRMI